MLLQPQQMVVAGHDVIRFRRFRAFQYAIIRRVGFDDIEGFGVHALGKPRKLPFGSPDFFFRPAKPWGRAARFLFP